MNCKLIWNFKHKRAPELVVIYTHEPVKIVKGMNDTVDHLNQVYPKECREMLVYRSHKFIREFSL